MGSTICGIVGGYEEDPFDRWPSGVEQEALINLSNGTPLELKDGYELDVQSVDIDGNKVYLELLKEGQVVDSQVIVAANEVTDTFVYIKPGTMQKIKVHFRNAFRGADKNLVSLDYIEQTSEIYPHRLLLNDTQLQTISSETALKLEEGYYLALKSLDIDGNKAYLELLKDGQVIYSQVIIAANEVDDTFVYSKLKTGQKITVHFRNAFRGADETWATITHVLQTSEIDSSRILINDSSYHTITSGTALKLEEGYEFAIKSLDIDGNRAYVELSKHEQVIGSMIVIPANEINDTFFYSRPGTEQSIMVQFKNAFRGAAQNLVTVCQIWQTSGIDPSLILINDTMCRTVASGMALELDEGFELAVQSIDIDGNKVYLELFKDDYLVDSRVIIPANEENSVFVYHRPEGPKIELHFDNTFRSVDQNLITLDHIEQVSEIHPNRIIINSTSSWILVPGAPMMLEEGYEIDLLSIDIDGNKAYLELLKDGRVIDSQVIIPSKEADDTFAYSKPNTAQKIEVHFKNAFRGAAQNLATVDHILQTSELDPNPILINDPSRRTLTLGKALKLEDGYELAVQSIDVDGSKAYVELYKDGEVVDVKIIRATNERDDTFTYIKPETGPSLEVHFKNAYRSAIVNLATIDRIS